MLNFFNKKRKRKNTLLHKRGNVYELNNLLELAIEFGVTFGKNEGYKEKSFEKRNLEKDNYLDLFLDMIDEITEAR